MIIYYGLIVFIGFISLFTVYIKDKGLRTKIIVTLSCIGIVIIQGLRNSIVGVDLLNYLPGLRYAENMNFFSGEILFNYEPGYLLYIQILSKLNVSDQIFLTIIAITIIVPIAYTWIKNSKMPGLSVFIYITLGFFTFTFSGLRQSIALAVVFFSFRYIKERAFLRFFLCILIAGLFHVSAVFFIPAYFLYSIKLRKRNLFFISFLGILVFIFKSQIFVFIVSLYRDGGYERVDTNSYTMLIVYIMVFILAQIFGEKYSKELNVYKNYLLVAIFVQIFASESNIIMRLGYYYSIFLTLLIPEVFNFQRDKALKYIGITILILALLVFYQITTGTGYLNVYPYYFYWQ